MSPPPSSSPPIPKAPWWWLAPDECQCLGIGRGARRTALGYVFGDGHAGRRLEIVPREQDAPVRLGPIALRVWGEATGARDLLRAAVDVLGRRLADDFDPVALGGFDAGVYATTRDTEGAPGTTNDELETLIEIPSVCDRACAFCEVSLRPIAGRRPRGSDEGVDRALAAAGRAVLFTGDDALSHQSIVGWVARAAGDGRRVSIIGPPRAGATASLAPSLARAGLVTWITAILGADAQNHDRVAGRAGAFAALSEAVPAMRAAGVRVELITPLARPLLGSLEGIARTAIVLTGAPPAFLAYAPDAVTGRAFDHVVPTFAELRAALGQLGVGWTKAEAGQGVRVPSFDGVALCLLPPALAQERPRVTPRFDAVHPAEPCDGCALRPRCSGVATTVVRVVGTAGLRAR